MEKKKLLIVDDDAKNLTLMTAILKDKGYLLETAVNGREAVEKASSESFDLVMLDIMMPEMDGYEACRRLRSEAATSAIPVVMVTALADRESKLKGLEAGANDFITKPIDPAEVALRVKNLLRVKDFEDFLSDYNRRLESDVSEKTARLNEALNELSLSREKLKEGYIDTIHRLTAVAEYKDEDTASHIKRIAHYCRLLAKNLGQGAEEQDRIFYASPMHDIGKVGIPSEILLKPGKLNNEEFALMRTHTVIGGRILRDSASEFIRTAHSIALSHHERYSGGGYPNGLSGEDIPLDGRIMNLADQYDALRSARPYKPAFSHEKTFKIITEGDGRTMPSHFDPRILEAFRDSHGEFERIFDTGRD